VQNDQLDDEAGAVKHGKFFFAPIQAQKCIARDGHAEFNKQYAETLDAFIQQAKTWLSMQEVNGVDNVRELYLQLLSKSPPPEIGYVASI
ncbi:MAG: DUF2855 family protein, partial [Gammaproteobacteria bacterium]|nr:DUF2855 family protein [Gammaproteobacteria bacterium]NNM13767.1 DUF2855 family protein [Gammaproteobacteria bacterium]